MMKKIGLMMKRIGFNRLQNNRKENKWKTRLIGIVGVLAAIVFVVLPALSMLLYNNYLGKRFETSEWRAYSVRDFEGLKVDACSFVSNNGQLLAGYQYYKEEPQATKGVLVLAHGLGGGGQNSYMDVANYFASHGYLVVAYDATGNDKSEGDSVEGLPQGVIDLDYALRYVKQTDKYKDLPIVLFGHSWGGYSVGAVLNRHPDVKAVVVIAGFNRSVDLIASQGQPIVGPFVKLSVLYLSLYEQMKFGEYASCSVMDGFANSDAGVMVVHSKDDSTVPPEYGYNRFLDAYRDSARFRFIEYEGRDHNDIYYSEAARSYREQLGAEFAAYAEANGEKHSVEITAEFMKKNLDKSKLYELDDNLMGQILAFYDFYCE